MQVFEVIYWSHLETYPVILKEFEHLEDARAYLNKHLDHCSDWDFVNYFIRDSKTGKEVK